MVGRGPGFDLTSMVSTSRLSMPISPTNVLDFLEDIGTSLSADNLLLHFFFFSSPMFVGFDIVCNHTYRVRNKLVT